MLSDFATNIFAFVIVLGFLIFFHEAGHFVMAKLFGVRVLVFSFGFGKRLFGFRRGDTDYRVSLIPLGGYVRMAGDTPEDNVVGAPDEFLSKPKWQRFLILFAGPFMNLLIAVGFVTVFNMMTTEHYDEHGVIGVVTAGKPAARAGLRMGDRITAIDGERMEDFEDMRLLISMNSGTKLNVDYLRDGVLHTTTLTPERIDSKFGPIGIAGIYPWLEPVVFRVDPGSAAARAGLRPGDRIKAVKGHPVRQFFELSPDLEKAKGAPLALDVERGDSIVHVTLPRVPPDEDAYRGMLPPLKLRKLGFTQALRTSVRENIKMARYTFYAIRRLFRPEGSMKELSGPIQIARISGDTMRNLGWRGIAGLMAMISLQLGLMNLLPVPVLDGGHILILLIEGIARRDLSLRVKERIQQLGFAALAALMIVVIYNDVVTSMFRAKG